MTAAEHEFRPNLGPSKAPLGLSRGKRVVDSALIPTSAPRPLAPAAPPGFVRIIVAMSASPFAAAPPARARLLARRGASRPADPPPRRLPSRFTRVVTAASGGESVPGAPGLRAIWSIDARCDPNEPSPRDVARTVALPRSVRLLVLVLVLVVPILPTESPP